MRPQVGKPETRKRKGPHRLTPFSGKNHDQLFPGTAISVPACTVGTEWLEMVNIWFPFFGQKSHCRTRDIGFGGAIT
jgi:hypothetical protein